MLGEGWVEQKWQCLCDVFIYQPLTLDNLDQHRVERRQGNWKAITMKPCIRGERKLGSGGLPPVKILTSRL